MNQSSGKITRRYSRQKSSRSTDAKGERFFLQGKRWRLPRGLSLQESEARIKHLRKLWSDGVFSGPRESHPSTTTALRWQDAFELLNRLSEANPSVPWAMSPHHIEETAQFHEQAARDAIVTTAEYLVACELLWAA